MVTVAAVTWSLVATARRLSIRVLMLTVCCPLWFPSLLRASVEDYEGKSVGAIVFDPASQLLTNLQLLDMLSVKTGQTLRLEDLRASIQRLYRTGEFADIAVDATLQNGTVHLRFITTPALFIGHLSAEGVPEPPNRGQITTAAKLHLGEEFSPHDVQQGVESITDLLKRNGFFNPLIQPTTTTLTDLQQVNIDFRILPGKRAKFAGVRITGNPVRPAQDIIRSSRWKGFRGWFPWRPLTDSRLQSGVESVRSWYLKHGYLLSKVTLTGMPFEAETNRVTPILDINPGPQVDVSIAGAKISNSRLRSLLPIYQERAVDTDLLREGSRDLADYFQSQGYFEADAKFRETTEKTGCSVEGDLDTWDTWLARTPF